MPLLDTEIYRYLTTDLRGHFPQKFNTLGDPKIKETESRSPLFSAFKKSNKKLFCEKNNRLEQNSGQYLSINGKTYFAK